MRGAAHRAAPLIGAAVVLSLVAACSGDAEGQPPTSKAACPKPLPKPAKTIKHNSIYLNVVNASSTAGLAGDTAVQLRWRGFHVLDTRNQSVDDSRATPKTSEVRYGSSGRQIALTVATQLANPTLVKDDRANPTVDVVIGEKFKLNPVPPPAAKSVKMNVYNTTYKAGLSGEVAKKLQKRGFQILKNGNDPQRQFLRDDVALIRHGERGEPAARRAKLQFKKARLVQDGRDGTDVDVVIGNKYLEDEYSDLVPEAKATPAPTKKPKLPAGC